ncbi:MAG: hypothetical protein LBS96_07425 [Oscillospiraceae bacterium]|jgi:hypothetical protein|nr:hypothetical protein [Oscillospiraceae bacterium]
MKKNKRKTRVRALALALACVAALAVAAALLPAAYIDSRYPNGTAAAVAEIRGMDGAARKWRCTLLRYQLARRFAEGTADAQAMELATRSYYQAHFPPVYTMYVTDPQAKPGAAEIAADAYLEDDITALFAPYYDAALDGRTLWLDSPTEARMFWNPDQVQVALECDGYFGDAALVRPRSILLAPDTYFDAANLPLTQSEITENPRQARYLLQTVTTDSPAGTWTETGASPDETAEIAGFTRTFTLSLLDLVTGQTVDGTAFVCPPPETVNRLPGAFGQPLFGTLNAAQLAELSAWLDAAATE